MTSQKRNNAFSLVELSIVLIIIGLLIAGISSGTKLIESSKVNHFIQEVIKVKSNIRLFKLTYNGLPGDLINAEDFFGASAVDNGDGDKTIEWTAESSQMPVHLYEAGMITQYTTYSSISYITTSTLNTKITVIYDQTTSYAATMPANTLKISENADNNSISPSLKPFHAKRLDTKIDDGLPKTGIMGFRIHAVGAVENECTTGVGIGFNEYNLSFKSITCNPHINLDKL